MKYLILFLAVVPLVSCAANPELGCANASVKEKARTIQCARQALDAGNHRLAWDTYMRLFKEGREVPGYQASRLTFLLSEMAKLATPGSVYETDLRSIVRLHETAARSGAATPDDLDEWDALVQFIEHDPNSYRVRFFDDLNVNDMKQVLAFVIWKDLASQARWQEIEPYIATKVRYSENDAILVKSSFLNGTELGSAELEVFVQEYELIANGLHHLGHDEQEEKIRALVREMCSLQRSTTRPSNQVSKECERPN